MSDRRRILAGQMSDAEIREDILSDLRGKSGARKNYTSRGDDLHESLSGSVDRLLDELKQVDNGTWRRKHG